MSNRQGGLGRGGRGAALLQLINQQVRTPGDASAAGTQQSGAFGTAPPQPSGPGFGDPVPPGQSHSAAPVPQQAASHAAAAPPSVPATQQAAAAVVQSQTESGQSAPLGRGAMLQKMYDSHLAQQSQSPTVSATPSETSIETESVSSAKSVGRAAVLKPIDPIAPGVPSPPAKIAEPLSVAELAVALPKADPGGGGDARRSTYLERMCSEAERDVVETRRGTAGTPIPLCCNYIAIRCRNSGVYQYAVSFSPEVDSLSMRRKLLDDQQTRDIIGEVKAFDGRILFLPKQLQNMTKNEVSIGLKLPTDQSPVMLVIKLVKVLPPDQCLQLYNIVFRRALSHLKMCQVGRDYYLPEGAVPVPQHRLEVWPGYITAINRYDGGLLMLTDVKHRVLRTETVLDVIYSCVNNNPHGYQDDIRKRLIGCVVLTRYNNKTYRVDDIAFDQSPQTTFEMADGAKVSFVDYYRRAYNKEIRDPQQPLLLHHPKKKDIQRQRNKKQLELICLIPELCYLTGLSDELRQDFRVMKDLATHTRVTPAARQASIVKLAQSMNSSPAAKAELDKWSLMIDEKLMEVEGRSLQPEMITLGGGRKISAGREADWSRELTRATVISAVDVERWVLVVTNRDHPRALEFFKMYVQCAQVMGIRVAQPAVATIPNDRTETFLQAIRSRLSPQCQLVVAVFPSSRDDRYNAIKKLCCVECPVPSQVIIAKTIDPKKLRSVTQKIALQINVKLGGELWSVNIPTSGLMVCGVDVYHEGKQKSNSVIGFVASVNVTCTRWYSRVAIQQRGEELINGLKPCFIAAIRKYHEVNHTMPKYIFVFRDGVGDGQLRMVKEFEVPQLVDCFANFGASFSPKLVVMVVQKRINQRIFAKTGPQPSQLDNPAPGTVLDHTVTRRDWEDFYIISQHVRQGTVSPTHYVIVADSSNLKIDHVQQITYRMTHMYYNWPGTVRVPAPCQYAHKLAYLVGQNIRKEPSDVLADRLFFL